jgi:hypothetical protein
MPPIPAGDWISAVGLIPAANMVSFQDVAGVPPFTFNVAGT